MLRGKLVVAALVVMSLSCQKKTTPAPDPAALAHPTPSAAPSASSAAPTPAPTVVAPAPTKPCDPTAALAVHGPAMTAGRAAMAKKDWTNAIREFGKAVDAWDGCTTNVAERAQVLAERGYAFVKAERPNPASDDLLAAWVLAKSLPDAKLRGAIAYNLGLASDLDKSAWAIGWFAISNEVNPTTAAESRVEASSCGSFGSAAEAKGATSTDVCPVGSKPPCALEATESGSDSYGDLTMIGTVTLVDADGPTTWSYPSTRGGILWRCAGHTTSTVHELDEDHVVVASQAVLSGPGGSPTGGMGCAPLVDLISVAVISRKKHARIALREVYLKDGKPYCPTSP